MREPLPLLALADSPAAPATAPAAAPAPSAAPAPVMAPAPAAPAATGPAETTGTEQPPPAASPPSDSGWSMFMMMAVVFAIFYFILIRPQQKRERERLALLEKIQKNDRVMTSGGILGTVHSVKDNVVVLKVDEDKDVKIRVTKASITLVEGAGAGDAKK
jgi:preprotein translocase subunit YajC